MFINSKILSVVGVLLVAVVTSQVRANLIQNPEFNDGLNYYSYGPAATTTTTTDHYYVGPNSGLLTFASSGTGFDGYSAISQSVSSITGGDKYQVSAAVDFQNVAGTFVEVAWIDSAVGLISKDYLLSGTQPADSGGWLYQTNLLTAPAGADTVNITIAAWGKYANLEAPSGYLWVDSVSVVPVPEPAAIGLLGLGGLLLARRRSSLRRSGR